MGGGSRVIIFLILAASAIMTFLYLDEQDKLDYDTAKNKAQRALIDKVLRDLRLSVGPSPVTSEPPQGDIGPSQVDDNSALDSLCEKYPWNNLCKNRPGWTGNKPIEADPPTPEITKPSAHTAMDTDKDGVLNFGEFYDTMSTRMDNSISEDDLFGAFNVFDRDSNGFISETEFSYTTGPSPMPDETQSPETIGPSPETLSSATFSFCEEYPWNNICKDRPGWTGIEPIYPSPDVIGPSPQVNDSDDSIPTNMSPALDQLCEQYPWNNLCSDREGWDGIEPIYTSSGTIGPSPMSVDPPSNTVTSELDSLCEKFPWNNLCEGRPGWTGDMPIEEADSEINTVISKSPSVKGYEALSAGRYTDAILNFTEAIAIAQDSEKPMLYNKRSTAYIRTGQFASALRDANMIDDEEQEVLKLERTADALYGLQRFTEAKNFYQSAIDINPVSDNLILGLDRAKRAEQLTSTSPALADGDSSTYTFTSTSTQDAYERALAMTNPSTETQYTNESSDDNEQSAIDVLCATTFWHELCKDRPGWTGDPPVGEDTNVDEVVLNTICDPESGAAPWMEMCNYRPDWTGEKPVETVGESNQSDVISYTDYLSVFEDISKLPGYIGSVDSNDTITTESQVTLSKWKYKYGIDVKGGALYDTFAYSADNGGELSEDDQAKNISTCLMKCNEQDHCDSVSFNTVFSRCWGKMSTPTTDTESRNDRVLYRKTEDEDGVLTPWNEEIPRPPQLGWRYKRDVDVVDQAWADHTFYYDSETDTKADLETCITKCRDQDDCKGVVFNTDNTMCWGKSDVSETRNAVGRTLFSKTTESDGVLEPWTPLEIARRSEQDANDEIVAARDRLNAFCTVENLADSTCSEYDGHQEAVEKKKVLDEKAKLDAFCTGENLADPKCSEYDGHLDAYCRGKKLRRWKCSAYDGHLNAFCTGENLKYPKCSAYDGHLDAFCKTNLADPKCEGQLEELCKTNLADPKCEGQLEELCKTNLADPNCSGYDNHDIAVSIANELDDEILAKMCETQIVDGSWRSNADKACRQTSSEMGLQGWRCGSFFGGAKCPSDACCSIWSWCGSGTKTGSASKNGWCSNRSGGGYIGRDSGRFDGTASQDEAGKIARRPSTFASDVMTRLALDAFCKGENLADSQCSKYDGHEKAKLDAFCTGENLKYPKCSAYDGHLDAFCKIKITDPKCEGQPGYFTLTAPVSYYTEWSVADLSQYLRYIGFEKYVDLFAGGNARRDEYNGAVFFEQWGNSPYAKEGRWINTSILTALGVDPDDIDVILSERQDWIKSASSSYADEQIIDR